MNVLQATGAQGPSSKLEKKFDLYWLAVEGPILAKEHRFHPDRKWRFDRADIASKTAVEIEGGVWTGGGHTRGKGYSQDCEKYNAANIEGWQVFRLTTDMITVKDLAPIAAYMVLRQMEIAERTEARLKKDAHP